jgi:hypothetical protein
VNNFKLYCCSYKALVVQVGKSEEACDKLYLKYWVISLKTAISNVHSWFSVPGLWLHKITHNIKMDHTAVDETIFIGLTVWYQMELISFFKELIFEDLIGGKVWWDSGLAGGAESEQWLGSHRVGTRDIVWQLATLPVQLYFPCTPSSQGVEGSTAAASPLGLSQSPFPLFLPQVPFSLCPLFGLPWKLAAGSMQGVGLGSYMFKTACNSGVITL